MFRRPSCGLTALVRLTIPRLSPRQNSQDFRFRESQTWRCCHRCSITNSRTVERSEQAVRNSWQRHGSRDEHVCVSQRLLVRRGELGEHLEHLEDLQKAREPLVERAKTRFAAERRRSWNSRTIEPSWREGGRRFARVCPPCSPTPTDTDLREARVLCLYKGRCTVGCYADQTLCKEGSTA